MARVVTLATLRTRALQRANLGTASNGAIIQNGQPGQASELTDCINEGIAELHDLILSQEDQPLYLESVTFNTASSTDTYRIGAGQAIPVTDFYRAKGVDIQFGQNIVRSAYPFTWAERNRYKYLGGWVYTQPVSYRLIGKGSDQSQAQFDSIKLMPQPSGQFTCTLWYNPTATRLTNLSDTLDGVDGFEEHVVLTAAIKLLMKQEQFEHAQALQAERGRQEARILAMIPTRDAENPPRVQDVLLNDGWLGRPYY